MVDSTGLCISMLMMQGWGGASAVTQNAETQPDVSRAALRAAAVASLREDGLLRRLPAPLGDRYDADSALPRSLALRRITFISVAAYVVIVLLLNTLVVSGPDWMDVAMQLTVTPTLALLITSLFYRPQTPALAREAAATVAACCFSVITTLSVAGSPAATAQGNFFLATLPMAYVLMFVRLRFWSSVLFTVFSATVFDLVLLVRADLAPAVRAYPMGFLLALSVPALFAVYRLELAARRAYLHDLLQDLRIDELAQENSALGVLSDTDPVTGAASRRHLDRALREACVRAAEGGALAGSVFVLLVDLDHFKALNDEFGHPAGDDCLRAVVDVMRAQLRDDDLVARFGGEEFAIVLRNASEAEAVAAAERVRQAVARHTVTVGGVCFTITISVGVAAVVPGDDAMGLVTRADAALYAAKRGGRNQVRVDGVPAPMGALG
jgi:diguanylate cyclase (GGDEF)-like protein